MPITEEQRARLDPEMRALSDALVAMRRDDMATACEHMSKVPIPPETLMAFKTCGDADLIREMGMNTTLADEKYGPGWLDREE